MRTIKKAVEHDKVSIVNFYDKLPTKNSDYAICVIPANDSAMELLDVTRDSIKNYASKCGADYIELSGNQNPDWPMANKYRLYKVTKAYKKTLYLDCDIVVKENAPNIFQLTPDNKISAYDEFEIFETKEDTQWILDQQEAILNKLCSDKVKQRHLDNGKFITRSMINGGVLVIPNELAEYYKQPDIPYPNFWCFDQHLLTLELPEDKLYSLSHEFNCEYVQDETNFISRSYDSYFIHINSIKGEPRRRKLLLSNFVSSDDFSKGKVCLMPCSLRRGGVESWHQQLAKIINPHRVVSYYESDKMWSNIFKQYGFTDNRDDAIEAANDSEIIISWLLGNINTALGNFNVPPFIDIVKNVDNFSQKKFITVIHNTIEWEYSNAAQMNFGKTVCVSDDVKSGYISYLQKNNIKFNEKNVITIENGPDSDRIKTELTKSEARKKLGIREDDILLLSCSRIHPQKNIEAMIDAIELLPENYKLIIVGLEGERSTFNIDMSWDDAINAFNNNYNAIKEYEKIDKLYLDFIINKILFSKKHVRVLPFCNNIGDILVAADVYLQPSRFEGYGLSAVEAMLYNIPVVGTDVGILKKIPTFKVQNQKRMKSAWMNCVSMEINGQDLKDTIESVFEDVEKTRSVVNKCYDLAVEMENNFKQKWLNLINEVLNGE